MLGGHQDSILQTLLVLEATFSTSLAFGSLRAPLRGACYRAQRKPKKREENDGRTSITRSGPG
jgi:hypothetical protein